MFSTFTSSAAPRGLGGPGITSGVGLMAKAFSASSQDDCDLVHGNDGCAG